jgi:hypothetical protein
MSYINRISSQFRFTTSPIVVRTTFTCPLNDTPLSASNWNFGPICSNRLKFVAPPVYEGGSELLCLPTRNSPGSP